jgi:hypothetical protein
MSHKNNSFLHWRMLARHHPAGFLLAAQLLSLVLYAVVDEHRSGRLWLGAVGVVILTLVVWVISRSMKVRWIAWAIAAPAFGLLLLNMLFAQPALSILSSILAAVLYFYAAGSLITYMLRNNRVTTDELFAAGATFTLLAWGFAYAYLACQVWIPNSFSGSVDPGQPRTFVELLSLSFTNLTATGSGDILALSAPSRVLVMLEQFIGIGYVAVVVSRLIGLTIGQSKNRRLP